MSNRVEIDSYLAAEEAAFDAMPQPLQTTDPALYNKLMAAKLASQRTVANLGSIECRRVG
ncbi:hypothetical protein [Nostoc sp. UHCC 0870]|uniref:hypothetical protein n=1 Tax=Nostoc sp. UHCC 0870 TaxID=2914041 RepID=UPI001EDFEABE|nr:hypothetical protein [Nostoc sp. UHCC 0870]UKO96807.1 hypothetical protein L6494_19660 [Nostoc sp. UHCC 0870]